MNILIFLKKLLNEFDGDYISLDIHAFRKDTNFYETYGLILDNDNTYKIVHYESELGEQANGEINPIIEKLYLDYNSEEITKTITKFVKRYITSLNINTVKERQCSGCANFCIGKYIMLVNCNFLEITNPKNSKYEKMIGEYNGDKYVEGSPCEFFKYVI